MSLPLLRLPFLALREVVKSMRTREIVLFPLISKICQNVARASIPRNSEFRLEIHVFRTQLRIDIYTKNREFGQYLDLTRHVPYKIKDEFLSTQFTTGGDFGRFEWHGSGCEAENERSMMKISKFFVEALNHPLISLDLNSRASEQFSMELMRFCTQQRPLFLLKIASMVSPESAKEILEKFVDENGHLSIYGEFTEGFEYTPPPGGFKFNTFFVSSAHWVKLNDFLQCREVTCPSNIPGLTPQYLNNIFKRIINMEILLEHLSFETNSITEDEFPLVVDGLNDSPIFTFLTGYSKYVLRKDGFKMVITYQRGLIILKQTHFAP